MSLYALDYFYHIPAHIYGHTFARAMMKASQSALRASVSLMTTSRPCGAVCGRTFCARLITFFTLGSPSILVARMSWSVTSQNVSLVKQIRNVNLGYQPWLDSLMLKILAVVNSEVHEFTAWSHKDRADSVFSLNALTALMIYWWIFYLADQKNEGWLTEMSVFDMYSKLLILA